MRAIFHCVFMFDLPIKFVMHNASSSSRTFRNVPGARIREEPGFPPEALSQGHADGEPGYTEARKPAYVL
jgi:hypothetical protein